MLFLISAVLAAASTTACLIVAFIGRQHGGHMQELAGFLAIAFFAATVALSIGAAGRMAPSRLSAAGWGKVMLGLAAFVILLPITGLVVAFLVGFGLPTVISMLPVTPYPAEDADHELSLTERIAARSHRVSTPELLRRTDPYVAH